LISLINPETDIKKQVPRQTGTKLWLDDDESRVGLWLSRRDDLRRRSGRRPLTSGADLARPI